MRKSITSAVITAVLFGSFAPLTTFAQSAPENDDLLDTTEKRLDSFMKKLEEDTVVDGPTSLDYTIWKKGFDEKTKALRTELEKALEGDKAKGKVGIMQDAESWRRRYDRIFSSDDRKNSVNADEADRQRPLTAAHFANLSSTYSEEIAKLLKGVGFLYEKSTEVTKIETPKSAEKYSIQFSGMSALEELTTADGGMACENAAAGQPPFGVSGGGGDWIRTYIKAFVIRFVLDGKNRGDVYACSNGHSAFIFNRFHQLSVAKNYYGFYTDGSRDYDKELKLAIVNLLHNVHDGAVQIDNSLRAGENFPSTYEKYSIRYPEIAVHDRDCPSETCVALKAYALNKWLANVQSYFVRTFGFKTKDEKATTFQLKSALFDSSAAEKTLIEKVKRVSSLSLPTSVGIDELQAHFLSISLNEVMELARDRCAELKTTLNRYCELNGTKNTGIACLSVPQRETLERSIRAEKRSVEKAYEACIGFQK